MIDKPDTPHLNPKSPARPVTPLPDTGIVTVGETPEDDPRRTRPTPEGDGLSPTRYGDWEQNGHCIDF